MDPDPASLAPSLIVEAAQVTTDAAALSEPLAGHSFLAVILWIVALIAASLTRSLGSMNGTARELLSESTSSKARRVLNLLDAGATVRLALTGFSTLAVASACVLTVQGVYSSSLLAGQLPFVLLVASVVLLLLLLVVTTKFIPRYIALRHGLSFAQQLSGPASLLHMLSIPITRPLAAWLRSVVDYGQPHTGFLSGEDLKTIADIGEAQGAIEEDERELIHSIVDIGSTTVREIMISRMDINALSVEATLAEALELIKKCGHSRLPLYNEHLDNIQGVIYAKDLLPFTSQNNLKDWAPDWKAIARAPMFVTEHQPAVELLNAFRERKKHLAIVLDEYGGTAGLVTLENVLEEIVGDIRDEYDEAEEELHRKLDDTTYVLDARIHLDDLNDLLKIELDTTEFDFDTLGGLIFHLKGDIPNVGEEMAHDALKMRIETIENHRIGRVLVEVCPSAENQSPVL